MSLTVKASSSYILFPLFPLMTFFRGTLTVSVVKCRLRPLWLVLSSETIRSMFSTLFGRVPLTCNMWLWTSTHVLSMCDLEYTVSLKGRLSPKFKMLCIHLDCFGLLSNIIKLDVSQFAELNEPKKYVWKAQQRCLFTEIMTRLLK